MNLTLEAIRARIAPGSQVDIFPLDEGGAQEVRDLLNTYIQVLELNHQAEAVEHLYKMLQRPQNHFVKIAPPMRVN
jgi:hypothetical protein